MTNFEEIRKPPIPPVRLTGSLTQAQATKIRAIARAAHGERMRARGSSVVAKEQREYVRVLASRLRDAEERVKKIVSDDNAAGLQRLDDEIAQLREQLKEGREELGRLQSAASAAHAAYASPTADLVDRILARARCSRADLGIAFTDSSGHESLTVART